MSSRSSTSGRSRQEVLPPLREILPEMHATRPDLERQYPRTLDDSPIGPTSRTGASGLAPSPLTAGNNRRSQQYANHFPHHSDSSISSNYSERSGSYITPGSVSSRSSTTRSSPALPAAPSVALPDRTTEYRDNRSLPPINTIGDGPRPSDPRYATSPQSARYPPQAYPPAPGPEYGSQYGSRPAYGSSSAGVNYPLNFDNLSDYGDKQKRRRGNLPKPVTDILRSWFTDHIAHPYPTEDEKVGLMQMTGLSMSQISNWFINARRRNLPQMTRQAQAEQELRESQSNMVRLSQTSP